MEDITAHASDTFVIPNGEIFAYGGESIQIKKHVLLPGHDILRGAILQDQRTGQRFFVTEADLARYKSPDPSPELG
ncbi:hypothetical protein [Kitasatospora sp. NPDC059673]|uniref:hypothetical protein n=1 Tax=Kitasatospora sp. NPDC059673 TaxID=3346901 RepID=UPI0036A752B7